MQASRAVLQTLHMNSLNSVLIHSFNGIGASAVTTTSARLQPNKPIMPCYQITHIQPHVKHFNYYQHIHMKDGTRKHDTCADPTTRL